MYLFVNEWKKIWKKNYIVFFLILTIIFNAAFFILTYRQTNRSQEQYTWYTLSAEETGMDGSIEEGLFESGEYDERDERMIQDLQQTVIDPLRHQSLDMANSYIGIEPHPPTGDEWHLNDNTVMTNSAQLNYLRQNEIEPRQPLRFQLSRDDRDRVYEIAENLIGQDREWATLYADYHESRFDKGWYAIWQLFIENAHFILLAVLTLLFGGFLSIEETKKKKHIHMLLSEGTNKVSLYLTKLVVALTSGAVFFATSFASILVASLFFIGTGTLQYPVLFHFYQEEAHLFSLPEYFSHPYFTISGGDLSLTSISLGYYLFQAIVFTLLIFFFVLSVCFLVSVFIKNELVASLVGISLIGLHYLLPVTVHNPLSYFPVHEVVSGEIRLLHENNAMSFEQGVTTLLLWSVGLTVIGVALYCINWQKVSIWRRKS